MDGPIIWNTVLTRPERLQSLSMTPDSPNYGRVPPAITCWPMAPSFRGCALSQGMPISCPWLRAAVNFFSLTMLPDGRPMHLDLETKTTLYDSYHHNYIRGPAYGLSGVLRSDHGGWVALSFCAAVRGIRHSARRYSAHQCLKALVRL